MAKKKGLINPEVQSSYSKLQEDPQGHVHCAEDVLYTYPVNQSILDLQRLKLFVVCSV